MSESRLKQQRFDNLVVEYDPAEVGFPSVTVYEGAEGDLVTRLEWPYGAVATVAGRDIRCPTVGPVRFYLVNILGFKQQFLPPDLMVSI